MLSLARTVVTFELHHSSNLFARKIRHGPFHRNHPNYLRYLAALLVQNWKISGSFFALMSASIFHYQILVCGPHASCVSFCAPSSSILSSICDYLSVARYIWKQLKFVILDFLFLVDYLSTLYLLCLTQPVL